MPRPVIPPYEAFAARAKELTRAIPAEFMEGVEDVVVHQEVKRHPLLQDIVTLGECEMSPAAAMTGTGVVRSIVHLYYGSFADLARHDSRFDVDGELRETIEHEIQHHIEDKAGVRTLVDEDDLFDAHQRFLKGLETPSGWWRRGERLEPDVYEVEGDLFVELRLRRRELERRKGRSVTMTVLGESFEAEIPKEAEFGSIFTYEGEGLLLDDDDGHAGHAHGHGHAAKGKAPPPRATQPGATDADPGRPSEGDEEDQPAAGDLHLVIVGG